MIYLEVVHEIWRLCTEYRERLRLPTDPASIALIETRIMMGDFRKEEKTETPRS